MSPVMKIPRRASATCSLSRNMEQTISTMNTTAWRTALDRQREQRCPSYGRPSVSSTKAQKVRRKRALISSRWKALGQSMERKIPKSVLDIDDSARWHLRERPGKGKFKASDSGTPSAKGGGRFEAAPDDHSVVYDMTVVDKRHSTGAEKTIIIRRAKEKPWRACSMAFYGGF